MTTPPSAPGSDAVPPGDPDPATDVNPAFATLWDQLGLAGADIAFDATIRPETLARAALDRTMRAPSKEVGISVATLPRLSIDLRGAGGAAASLERVPGDIVITGVLGEGGMGRVLAAHQRSLARDVAVKTVHERFAGTPLADALVAEGLVTGHLEHPNITPVHQLGHDGDGRPLLVMKRITGVVWRELIEDPAHPFWERLASSGASKLRAHVDILMQVTNAVSFAHARGVVHRDIKPENVMIGEFGEVYICDWGIATKLPVAGEGGLVGTPAYLAPEMLDPSGEVGPRTDVHLLGGTLHTVLTGRPRHEGDDLREVLEGAFASEPVVYGPDVPRELAELANRATAHDPARRPASAAAFRAGLASYLSHETSRALASAATRRLQEIAKSDAERSPAATLSALAECRYGFREALREWSDNADAAAGLERCLAHEFRCHIAAENLAGARGVLAEMKSTPAELAERVRALAEKLVERAEASRRLAALQREEDLSLGAKQRRILLAVLLGVGLTTSMVMTLRRKLGATDTEEGAFSRFGPSLIIFCTTALGFALARKQLLVNRVNRRVTAVMLGAMAVELVHRAETWVRGERLETVLRGDMLILGAAVSAAALFLSPRWFIPGAVLLAASVLAAFVPAITLPAFLASHLGVFVFMAFAWSGERRDPPTDPSAGERPPE